MIKLATFLAECGPEAGLGHLRRLLVLAEAFKNGKTECEFLLTNLDDAPLVQRAGFAVKKWSVGNELFGAADVVVIDGYHFDTGLPAVWKAASGCVTVVVDDLADRPTEADIVLNHNLYGDELDYSAYRASTLLLGPEYALVHPGFAALGRSKRPQNAVVLISFGGTDDGRYGVPAARAILRSDHNVVVDLVIAPRSSVTTELSELVAESGGRCTVHRGASMTDRMACATLYFGAAGVTLLEALAADLKIVVCGIAENQRHNIAKLRRLSFSAFDTFSPDRMAAEALRLQSASHGASLKTLIDGEGASRVFQAVSRCLSVEERPLSFVGQRAE